METQRNRWELHYLVHFQRFTKLSSSISTDIVSVKNQGCECLERAKSMEMQRNQSELDYLVHFQRFTKLSSSISTDIVSVKNQGCECLWKSGDYGDPRQSGGNCITWFSLNASLRCRAPSAPISFAWRSSVVSVCKERRVWRCSAVGGNCITRFTFNTSLRRRAPSS